MAPPAADGVARAGESRRAYGVALLLLAAGGLGLVFAFSRTWATAQVPLLAGEGGTARVMSATGGELLPAAGVTGWLSLACVAGIIATRTWGRTAVGVVAALAGVVGLGAGILVAVAPSSVVGSALPGATGVQGTGAWLLAVLAGLAVALAGGWTIVRGRGWPTMGARYDRGDGSGRAARRLSTWEAQDQGQDPTDDLVE